MVAFVFTREMGRSKIFSFKQFDVLNDKTAMKVGTDGVLLGAWCNVAGARHILDVGTGCGVIALMVAQRNPDATILGIDIDASGVEEASYNFAHSPWGDRLQARHIDFNAMVDDAVFDLIVSNPPFFTSGVLPPNQNRLNARHTCTLTYESLITGAKKMLSPQGRLALVTPSDLYKDIVEVCTFNSLNINRITEVVSVMGTQPKRLLWEITAAQCELKKDRIIIEDSPGKYNSHYVDLCRDFYLKF